MTLSDLLDALSIDYRDSTESHHARMGWLVADCPTCSPRSQHFRCGIHTRSLGVHCFVCGKLKLSEVLSGASGRSLGDVLRLMSQLDRFNGKIEPEAFPAKANGKYTPPPGVGELLPVHRNYLSKRHLDPDYCVETWKVQGIGPEGSHKWRVFLPIHVKQKPVTWTSRSIGSSPMRYLSASPEQQSVDLKHTVFGGDFVGNVVCVVEGPLDAMRIGRGAVALYGTGFSDHQVCLLSCYSKRVICFDPDGPGRIAAQRLENMLSVFAGETLNVELSTGDPGDAEEWEIQELREMLK